MNTTHFRSMKRLSAIALAMILCLTCAAALAETANSANTVTATGSATVTLAPDMATFSVGVSTQDATVANAQDVNSATIQAVLDGLKSAGVAPEDLQTANYSIYPVYDYQTGKLGDQQTLTGYTVSNTVTVTVRQLDQLSALLDAAVTAGANESYGINFSSTQSPAAYDQALQAAVQDAIRKAGLMAQSLGRNIGAVLTIREVTDNYSLIGSAKTSAYDLSSNVPVETGTLSVSATVEVVLELK